jgi:hypothetical protein
LGLLAMALAIRSPVLDTKQRRPAFGPGCLYERNTRALVALSGCIDDTNQG